MIQEDVPSIHIAPDYGLLEAIDTENQGISVAISGIPKYQVPSVSWVRPITSQPLLLDAVRGFRLNNVWKLLFPCALVCVGKPWKCEDFHLSCSTAGCKVIARCLTSYAWIFGISSSSLWLGRKSCEENQSWEDGAVGKMIRTQALGLLNPFFPDTQ